MASTKLKYKIEEIVKNLPGRITISSIEKILQKDHNVSSITFYRDRITKITDDFSIPHHRLEVYASLFGCTVDDLKNYTSKKIKSLAERKLSPTAKSVIKKAKLKKA